MSFWWCHFFRYTQVWSIMSSFLSHLDCLVAQPMNVVVLIAGKSLQPLGFNVLYPHFSVIHALWLGNDGHSCNPRYCSDSTTMGLIKVGSTYPFGLDPVWHGTRSELPFLNSLKMKMSILLGVAQMNLGIIISYFNATFFRNSINIWWVFFFS